MAQKLNNTQPGTKWIKINQKRDAQGKGKLEKEVVVPKALEQSANTSNEPQRCKCIEADGKYEKKTVAHAGFYLRKGGFWISMSLIYRYWTRFPDWSMRITFSNT